MTRLIAVVLALAAPGVALAEWTPTLRQEVFDACVSTKDTTPFFCACFTWKLEELAPEPQLTDEDQRRRDAHEAIRVCAPLLRTVQAGIR